MNNNEKIRKMSELLNAILYHCLCHQHHCGPDSCDPPQTGQHPAQHQAGYGHGTSSWVDKPLQKINVIETSKKSLELKEMIINK